MSDRTTREIAQRLHERQGIERDSARYRREVKSDPTRSAAVRSAVERAADQLAESVRLQGKALAMGPTSRKFGVIYRELDAHHIAYLTVHVALHAALASKRRSELHVAHTLGATLLNNTMLTRRTNNGGVAFDWWEGDPIEWTPEDLDTFCLQLLRLLHEDGTLIQITGESTSEPWHVALLDRARQELEAEVNHEALARSDHTPMLTQPQPWDAARDGGFYDDRLRKPLVRGGHDEGIMAALALSPHVQHGMRWLSETPFAINAEVLDAAMRGYVNLAAEEQLAVSLAGQYREVPAFWLPRRPDYRGRVYIDSDVLNPDNGDLSRGLLRFAKGEPLGTHGRYWLALHIANCYGRIANQKRLTLDERVLWTEKHGRELLAAELLDAAKDRWQYLAAALEWRAMLASGDHAAFRSHIPVMLDARSSGAQHYAMLTRSEDEGKLAGLVRIARPIDLYMTLAEDIDRDAPGRDLIKAFMNPVSYGSTVAAQARERRSPASQRMAALGMDYAARQRIVRTLNAAVKRRLRAQQRLMEWFKKVAEACFARGVPVSWATPSGWEVVHEPRVGVDPVRLNVWTFRGGKNPHRVRRYRDWIVTNESSRKAMAPNFVHSIDAAHLMLTIGALRDRGVHSFAAVHDCIGVHARNVPLLRDVLRETFAGPIAEGGQEMLAHLERLSGVARPPVGGLDPREVLAADYLFD